MIATGIKKALKKIEIILKLPPIPWDLQIFVIYVEFEPIKYEVIAKHILVYPRYFYNFFNYKKWHLRCYHWRKANIFSLEQDCKNYLLDLEIPYRLTRFDMIVNEQENELRLKFDLIGSSDA